MKKQFFVTLSVGLVLASTMTACQIRTPIDQINILFVQGLGVKRVCDVLTVEFPSKISSTIYRGKRKFESNQQSRFMLYGDLKPPVVTEDQARIEIFQFTATCASQSGESISVTKLYQFNYEAGYIILDISEFK
jgi:hypothetical protein